MAVQCINISLYAIFPFISEGCKKKKTPFDTVMTTPREISWLANERNMAIENMAHLFDFIANLYDQ